MLVEEVIPVAVIVDKKKAESRWIDHIWVPARVVTGLPETEPMTRLRAMARTRATMPGRRA